VTLDPATEAANQLLLDSLMNGHEPTVVVFGKEGASFSDPSSHWKADHGGNSWASQHIPLLIAGPGIKQGETIDTPAQLEDVAPTALAALGVSPTGMEGQVLSDALQNPTKAQQGARAAEQQLLQPLVTGMNNQAARDLSSQS
jgi:arylsulfatase A-like enzyme